MPFAGKKLKLPIPPISMGQILLQRPNELLPEQLKFPQHRKDLDWRRMSLEPKDPHQPAEDPHPMADHPHRTEADLSAGNGILNDLEFSRASRKDRLFHSTKITDRSSRTN